MLTRVNDGNSQISAEKSASSDFDRQVGLGEVSIVAKPCMHS